MLASNCFSSRSWKPDDKSQFPFANAKSVTGVMYSQYRASFASHYSPFLPHTLHGRQNFSPVWSTAQVKINLPAFESQSLRTTSFLRTGRGKSQPPEGLKQHESSLLQWTGIDVISSWKARRSSSQALEHNIVDLTEEPDHTVVDLTGDDENFDSNEEINRVGSLGSHHTELAVPSLSEAADITTSEPWAVESGRSQASDDNSVKFLGNEAQDCSPLTIDTETFNYSATSPPDGTGPEEKLNSSALDVALKELQWDSDLCTDSKYDLRPLADVDPSFMEAWYDMDESGTFDPRRPLASLQTSRKRARKLPADEPSSSGEQTNKRQRIRNLSYGRWTEDHAPVTFHFSQVSLASSGGQRLIQAIKNSMYKCHWPCLLDALLQPEENFTDLSVSSVQPNKLRDRREVSRHFHRTVEDSLIEVPTLGHPAARGCHDCFKLGLTCSLLDDREVWPCRHCHDDGEDCEMILEPSEKRACGRCRKRRIVCSFRTNENHAGPCSQCHEKGYKCIAGPKSGHARNGPSLAANYTPLLSPPVSELGTFDDEGLISQVIDYSAYPVLSEDPGESDTCLPADDPAGLDVNPNESPEHSLPNLKATQNSCHSIQSSQPMLQPVGEIRDAV